MAYVFGWLVSYALFFSAAVQRNCSRVFATAAVLALGLLAILRGAIGTDTVSIYQSTAQQLMQSGLHASTEMEWGFRLLLYGLVEITRSPVLAVRGVAVVFTLLLAKFAFHSNLNERLFLFAIFVPIFFYQFGLNAERIGIACALLILSLQYFRLGKDKQAVVAALLSVSFHISALVIIGYVIATSLNFKSKRFYMIVLLVIAGAIALAVLKQNYVETKLNLYGDYPSPNKLSGLSQVAIVAILLLTLTVARMNWTTRLKIFSITTFLTIGFFVLAHFSYAGLRLLSLMSFALPYALVLQYTKASREIPLKISAVFFVAGLVGAALFYRNMFDAPHGVAGAFMPYTFLWQN